MARIGENVTPLPIVRRMRIKTPPTIHQIIAGICADAEALGAHPTASDIQGIIDRFSAIRDRLSAEEMRA